MSRFGDALTIQAALDAALAAPIDRADATVPQSQGLTIQARSLAWYFAAAVVTNVEDWSRFWWVLRLSRGDAVPQDWTGAHWAQARALTDMIPAGEPATERGLQMARELFVLRRLTADEMARVPAVEGQVYAVQLFGGPVRERWRAPGLRPVPWLLPCTSGRRAQVTPTRTAPVDCGRCGPCMARRAANIPTRGLDPRRAAPLLPIGND